MAKLVVGKNDLETMYPDIAAEWHPVLNETTPDMVAAQSNKRAWFICKTCGYVWQTRIFHRTAGCGCPACARHKKRKQHEVA